ncbi:MAG: HAMP domain-containing protein [Desulfarculus sp.]|nr:HAMP domain-containing protein [Desulfarculus sp.]
MKPRLSFQTRVLIGGLAVVLCTLLFVAVLLERSLGERILSQVQGGLEKQLTLAVDLVSDRWRPSQGLDASENLAEDLGRKLGLRITLITPQGLVVGDSEVGRADLERLENHARRPEVVAAMTSGQGSSIRYSSTLGVDLLYVAGLVGDPSRPGLVVRLALPLSELNRTLTGVRRLVLGAMLLGVLLSVGVAFFMARGISRPLKDLTRTAQIIASGDLSPRVRRYPRHEVGDLGRAFDRMADTLQQKIEDITAAHDRQDGILSAMMEGVMLVDPEGRILLVNQALMRLLDLTRDPVGLTSSEMVRNPDLQDAVGAVLAGQPYQSREIRTLGSNPRHLEVHVARLAGDGPQAGGAVAVFHDISERKRVEKMRRDFVANVSHELRTPLTAIRGSAETLLDGALESPHYAKHFVEMIERHTQRLQRLVEDLLDLARLESGQAPPKKDAVDAAELADAVLATFSDLAAEKGLELTRSLPREGLKLWGDRRQLEQAVLNLMDNAIKYTQPGGKVGLSFRAGEGGSVIAVSDTGPGIDPQHLPRLFERFYRVDKDRSREMGGTGLGLAIVKHIVQAHGGSLEVDSQPGRGSEFRLIIPAA